MGKSTVSVSAAPREFHYNISECYYYKRFRSLFFKYRVNFNELHIGLNVRMQPAAALKVINGKVVALCKLLHGDAKVFTLRDNPLLCYGHGNIIFIRYM